LVLDHSSVEVLLDPNASSFSIKSTARAHGKTGVEMECLVATSIAAATVYDMIKAQAPEAVLGPFSVQSKLGGKLGPWHNPGLLS
jgi:cyclic pyranopterin phosphate synthase